MPVYSQTQIFGSRRRTEILILLALLENSYPSELTRLLEAPLYSVQTILGDLESQGIVASRRQGRMRIVSLDPRYFASKELRSLLLRLAEAEPVLDGAAATRRTRPRQTRRIQ
jgi:DNA-binding transcriptional ArsR family regulator